MYLSIFRLNAPLIHSQRFYDDEAQDELEALLSDNDHTRMRIIADGANAGMAITR